MDLSPGFTAVVGPNGSGKSNILDALKWALGDSNPGRLRIQRQQDLVFQGSVTKPPAKFAEVTLLLKDEGSFCEIKRRWSPSEGGTVMVDGEKVRLTDLDEVKRKWKLGVDRFAFIGQGEIAEVIQQGPSQRREHFEALFGIDVYRAQREGALARLKEAKDELVRLETLAAELRNRKESIAPEVSRALKAKELLDRLDELKRCYYFIKKNNAEKIILEVAEKIRLLERNHGVVALWPRLWGIGLEYGESKRQELQGRVKKLWDESQKKSMSLENMKKEMFGHGTTIKDFLGHEEGILEDLNKERVFLENLLEEKSEAEKSVAEAQERLLHKEDLLKAIRERRKLIDEEIKERERRRNGLLKRKEHLERNLELLRSDLSKTGKICFDFGKERDELQLEITALQGKISALTEDERKAQKDLEEALAKHGGFFSKLQGAASRLQKLRKEITKTASFVEDIEDTIYGQNYPKPVRHLLSASRLDRLGVKLSVVAETIEGPQKILSAIEAFLGGRQYWVLVEDLDAAGQCIKSLRDSAAGRATFLPLEKARPRTPSAESLIEGLDGVISWACDLIKIDEKWETAIRHLMGDLLIVKDYDTAKELSRRGFPCPIVTLEGDVLNPSGTVVGGSKDRKTGAITSRAHLLEKKTYLEQLEREKESLQREIELLEKEEHSWSLRKQAALRDADLVKSALEETRKRLSRLEQRKEDVECLRQKALKKLKELGRGYLNVLQELEQLKEDLLVEEEKHLSIGELKREEEQAKVAVEIEAEKLKAAQDILNRIASEEERLKKSISSREESARLSEQRRKFALEALKALGQQYLSEWNARNELIGRIHEIEKEIGLWENRLSHLKKKKAMADIRFKERTLEIEELKLKKASAETELAELAEMWDGQAIGPSPLEETERRPEEIKKKIRQLERTLKEMGNVQMGVLSEDESLQRRLEYLGEQLRDVSSGIEELERLISKADEHASRIFKDALRNINSRFSELFKNLFGGGEAQLRMAEGGDLWESGVEVIACPPGKRPQHIGQLSGGEQSLAAISLLFAAMEVAEVPIAVLDEVDAALDESNLRRFAALAEEYGKRIQLLCMTHRRATMEHADIMYGVTLSEPGLSQIVGVRLEDWD